MPPGMKWVVTAGNLVLMAGFGALLAYYGGIAAASFAGRSLISLDLPVTLFRGAMALGGFLIAVMSALRLAGLLTGQSTPDDFLPESDA
jgi:TRAP-type C4-dicarboxylate transport system permease small subunit